VAVEFVEPERMRELNREHRGRDSATDVLSFPVDGDPGDAREPSSGAPLELGDLVICPELTADVREVVVHGALHLAGMDHEVDEGEMLALQAEILRWVAE
jgi:probable rRNA maturation factor